MNKIKKLFKLKVNLINKNEIKQNNLHYLRMNCLPFKKIIINCKKKTKNKIKQIKKKLFQ